MKLLSQRGISVAPPECAAVSSVPSATSVSSVSAAPSVPSVPAAVPAVPVSTTALLTPSNDPADVSMEGPPHPEGSLCATGGILRNQAMGQHYNPVDHEELHISSIVEKVKGVIKIY